MKFKFIKSNLYILYMKLNLFLLIFILKYNFKNCQISDDFTRGTLEASNFNLLDISNYANQKIRVWKL